MRTGHSLTVCLSLLPRGGPGPGGSGPGGVYPQGGLLPGGPALGGVWSRGVCSGGCLVWGVCSRGVVCSQGGWSAPRGECLLWGCLLLGGCLLWGCVCSRGWVSAPGGYIPACTEANTPPPLWTDTRL